MTTPDHADVPTISGEEQGAFGALPLFLFVVAGVLVLTSWMESASVLADLGCGGRTGDWRSGLTAAAQAWCDDTASKGSTAGFAHNLSVVAWLAVLPLGSGGLGAVLVGRGHRWVGLLVAGLAPVGASVALAGVLHTPALQFLVP